MKQQELLVLSNVIAVARRELADRDDEEIPSRLRKAARDSSKRLPPPYARAVLKELQVSDGFRTSVQQRWNDEGIDDPVGEAFISDPENELLRVSERAEAQTLSKVRAELERSQRSVAELEKQLDESKRRLAELRKMHAAELADAAEAAAASRKSLEGRVRVLDGRILELEAVSPRLSDIIEGLRKENEDLKGRLDRSARKARKRATPAQANGLRERRSAEAPSDPVELAGWLDALERTQRTYREAKIENDDESTLSPALHLPDGLLPDTKSALSALVEQAPDVIYIDGYNVAASLAEDFATASARAMVVAKANRLASASGARVIVVFDAVGVDVESTPPEPGLAEVRFAHTQIADDEIVEMAHANRSRAVVITSDRELSLRCEPRCVTVWSEAFIQWAGH